MKEKSHDQNSAQHSGGSDILLRRGSKHSPGEGAGPGLVSEQPPVRGGNADDGGAKGHNPGHDGKLVKVPGAKISLAKIPKLKSGDDEAVAKQLTSLFHDAQNGLRRIVALGIFAHYVKEKLLKRTQFGPWVEAHCSQHKVSYRAIRWHMQVAETALEACGYKTLGSFFNKVAQIANGNALPIAHPGELLLLPEKSVPDEAKPIREKMFSLIDGKSGRQLLTEWKQAEDDEDGDLKGKRGRRKGQGGASAAQRAAAKAKAEEAEIEAYQLKGEEFIEWGREVSDVRRLFHEDFDSEVREEIFEVAQLLLDCQKAFKRKGAEAQSKEGER